MFRYIIILINIKKKRKMNSNSKEAMSINLRKDQIEALKNHKNKTGASINAAIRIAIDAYLKSLNAGVLENERNTGNSETENTVP